MNNNLVIVARIEAKKNKVEFIKKELKALISPTLKEEGCIEYKLNQDNDNPAVFIFFEVWENRELWQQHMNSPHLTNFIGSSDGSLESLTVNEMTSL